METPLLVIIKNRQTIFKRKIWPVFLRAKTKRGNEEKMQTQEKSKKEEIMKEKNMISKLKQNKRNYSNSYCN